MDNTLRQVANQTRIAMEKWVTAHFLSIKRLVTYSKGAESRNTVPLLDIDGKLDNTFLKTGAGGGIDADTLDGQQGTYYQTASGYTAADVLTKIKTVDGAASGLDADLLDGLHAAAFASLTGATFTGPLQIQQNGSNTALVGTDHAYMEFYPDGIAGGRKAYFGHAAPTAVDVTLASEYSGGGIELYTGGVRNTYLSSDGDLAIGGPHAPQGALHIHNGTGGFGFFTKTAIDTTAQVIIPDGTGDVTKHLLANAIATNGTAIYPNTIGLNVGGTADFTCGSDTYQVRVNANGSVDVRRTAGSVAGTIALSATWI